MKSFYYSILFFILLPLFIFGQEPEFFCSDTDTIISDGELDPPVEYTPPINLTGTINVMVMVIGFPDRNNDWPVITDNNQYFPVLGAFQMEHY